MAPTDAPIQCDAFDKPYFAPSTDFEYAFIVDAETIRELYIGKYFYCNSTLKQSTLGRKRMCHVYRVDNGTKVAEFPLWFWS